MNLYEAIFVRKSVRNYCFDTLPPQTLDKIWEHYKEMPALFSGIGVDMAILDNRKGQERMLSMFSVKAPYYMAFYSEESERYLMNVGYIMEQMVLYLCSIGLGTCFIGSNRVKKAELEKNGKRLVGIVAFGKSHGSHTRRQSEAKRLPLEDLCVFKEAPRRPAPEPEAAAPAGDEEPTGKKRLRMPAFGFMKRKAAPLSDEVEDDVPDEEILVQRQRTRYRLVGAAALMLGVIVVSPLLLDREQDVKPPVSTEIPAVPETARTTLNALPGSSGDVDVTANGAAAEQSTSRANLANEARQPVKTEPAPKAEAAKPAPAPAARPEPKKAEEKPAKKSSATDGKGFYVQVLATSSERNAEKLVRELSAKGYPAYKVSVSQKAGTLWRVRVGNYATRDEARGVQGTLVLDGHTGQLIVGNNP